MTSEKLRDKSLGHLAETEISSTQKRYSHRSIHTNSRRLEQDRDGRKRNQSIVPFANEIAVACFDVRYIPAVDNIPIAEIVLPPTGSTGTTIPGFDIPQSP